MKYDHKRDKDGKVIGPVRLNIGSSTFEYFEKETGGQELRSRSHLDSSAVLCTIAELLYKYLLLLPLLTPQDKETRDIMVERTLYVYWALRFNINPIMGFYERDIQSAIAEHRTQALNDILIESARG